MNRKLSINKNIYNLFQIVNVKTRSFDGVKIKKKIIFNEILEWWRARARFENDDPRIDEAEGNRFKKRDQLFPQFWPVS